MTQSLIIIPTYNERDNITLIIPEIKRVLPGVHILVVDDSSPDGTGECVNQLAGTFEGLFLLSRPKKQGLGRAYISGFKWALERSYEFIFEMDADFSHDPKYLPEIIATAADSDLVLGSRYLTGVNVVNWPLYRLLISYGGNFYARKVTGMPIRDCTGGFKCFRRKVLESINLDQISASGYSFQIEMNWLAWKKGFRIKEVPIIFVDRKIGESKMSTKIFREGLLLIWKLRLSALFHKKV